MMLSLNPDQRGNIKKYMPTFSEMCVPELFVSVSINIIRTLMSKNCKD